MEKKPMLSELFSRHELTAIAVSHAAQVADTVALAALCDTPLLAGKAKALLDGINQLAHTQYKLDDISKDCYYGELVTPFDPPPFPIKRFCEKGEIRNA